MRSQARSRNGRAWVAHSEETRSRIRTGMLVERLQDFAAGHIKMTATQVNAAKTLLDRTMPTLQAVQLIVDRRVKENKEDLLQRAKALGMDTTALFSDTPVKDITQNLLERDLQSKQTELQPSLQPEQHTAAIEPESVSGCTDVETSTPSDPPQSPTQPLD